MIHDMELGEIRIYSDAGRAMRPLFIVDEETKTLAIKHSDIENFLSGENDDDEDEDDEDDEDDDDEEEDKSADSSVEGSMEVGLDDGIVEGVEGGVLSWYDSGVRLST